MNNAEMNSQTAEAARSDEADAARRGDRVLVHYQGRVKDGPTFSSDQEPLRFVLGGQAVMPGFETSILGMQPGQTKTFTVTAVEGFGQRREDAIISVRRCDLPPDLKLTQGSTLRATDQNGQSAQYTILSVDEESVSLDANHPLAGQDVEFEVTLLAIERDE